MLNDYLLAPIIASLLCQVIKFFIKSNHLKFTWRNLMAYSGMPSSHSALVISSAVVVGLRQGLTSPLFALVFLWALMTIRDAAGVRKYVGQQGKIINELVKDLDDDQFLDDKYPRLLEKVGHTPAQILAGSIIGALVGLISYLIFN